MSENTRPYYAPSGTVEWSTAQEFFDGVSETYGPFELDSAAADWNAKCERYYTKEIDGLTQKCDAKNVWCNPPYGHSVGAWVEKAWSELQAGNCERVVMLLKATTDVRWFHDVAFPKTKLIGFVKGRLTFGGRGPAPFPSILLVFEKDHEGNTTCVQLNREGKVIG